MLVEQHSLDDETGGFQPIHDVVDRLRIARLALDLDYRVLRRKPRKMRLWLISMMLTPASWNLAVIAASAPGRSCAATRSRAMRPCRTRSRTRTLASRCVSMFPPHNIVPTFLPAK